MADDMGTKPTIDTVLEKIKGLGDTLVGIAESFNARFEKMEARFEKMETEFSQLRQDVNTGFRRVERKIEILNDNLLTMQANHRDLLVRVEDLESKAS
ncbi:MAG TPA: hypothetical protein VIG62_00965 [Blastocatellia bacterium]|jgi:uncharacterized protein YoxC